MAPHFFVKITSLSGLNYNSREHKNLKLFTLCMKEMYSTSSFFLAFFGLISNSIKQHQETSHFWPSKSCEMYSTSSFFLAFFGLISNSIKQHQETSHFWPSKSCESFSSLKALNIKNS
jgi:hypothetical protein